MAIYSSRNAPSLKTKAVVFEADGRTVKKVYPVQFVDGVFETDNPDIIRQFDQLIAEKPNFSQLVMKVDRDKALSVSQEWQREQALKSQVARGGTDSETANLSRRAEQLRAELIEQGQSPEMAQQLIDEMKGDNNYGIPEVAIDPETGEVKGADTPEEGFQAGARAKEGDGDPSTAIPEGTEEQATSANEVSAAPSMKNAGNPFAGAKKG